MEKYYRKTVECQDKILEFQAISWEEFDEQPISDAESDSDAEDNSEMGEYNTVYSDTYKIRVFGVTKKSESVTLNITNFTPFFYIKLPDNYSDNKVKLLLDKISNRLGFFKDSQWVSGKSALIKESCIILKRKTLYGFTNEKYSPFLRLVFNNKKIMKNAANVINYHNETFKGNSPIKKRLNGIVDSFEIFEANLDPVLRVAHLKNLQLSGWLSVKDPVYIDFGQAKTQIEAEIPWTDIQTKEDSTNAPILQASYDIETYSCDGMFPLPTNPENVVFQIATCFKHYGAEDFLVKHIICLKKCAPIHYTESEVPIVLECYNTELEVLLAWSKMISGMDPDILYSYNGNGFDDNYLVTRIKLLQKQFPEASEFFRCGKLSHLDAELVSSNFSSSAYGSTDFKRLIMPGRINFDVLTFLRREYKEESYRLDYIAEKYLGKNKNPVTPAQMFEYFREGHPEKIRTVAEYCIMDTLLPQLLVDKMCILQSQISMSNITHVPIRFLIERGQMIKTFSQILKITRKKDYLVPTFYNYNKDLSSEDSFQGATVKTPNKGAYFSPVTVSDFASLYPSIIAAHNLCYSTIVLDPKYLDIPGISYITIDLDSEEVLNEQVLNRYPVNNIHSNKNIITFVKNVPGILPELVLALTESRKKYKGLMKSTSDPFLKEVYNKCQLAVKVSTNSVYGFLASPMICCKPIAAAVTRIGRSMIEETSKYIENNYDSSTIVYGDSVTGDTPLILKGHNGLIVIKSIESLANDPDSWTDYSNFKPNAVGLSSKQQIQSVPYLIWVDSKWTRIRRIIRHHTNKKLFRINSEYGSVDVTEDHSLLTPDREIIKPTELLIGNDLLYSYPLFNTHTISDITENHAYLLGTFDASSFTNIDTIINTRRPIILSYLKGYLDSITKGDYLIEFKGAYSFENILVNTRNELQYITIKTKLAASKFYYILQAVYNNVTVTELRNSSGVDLFTLKVTRNSDINSNTVYNIRPLNNTKSDFVYDIETEEGRFLAGVGKTVVKNTDSVFVKYNTVTTNLYEREYNRIHSKPGKISEEDSKVLFELKTKCIQESMDTGKKASDEASALFKHPIKLEFEKVYGELFMLTKKRYIGSYYTTNPKKPDYIDKKGVILQRRDIPHLLKETYQFIIDKILNDGKKGVEEGIEYLKQVLYDIASNKVNIDKLVISKTLKTDYKNKNIPHLVLANKIAERDPGNAYKSNDRVPYIFIDIGSKKKISMYHCVEDPEYAKEHDLPVNVEYYINFMKNSICEVLKIFIDEPENIFKEVIQEYKEVNW